jgi:hypothetical protein
VRSNETIARKRGGGEVYVNRTLGLDGDVLEVYGEPPGLVRY